MAFDPARFVRRTIRGALRKLPMPLLENTLSHSYLRSYGTDISGQPFVNGRQRVWQSVVDRVGADKDVLFLEFGVFKGESFRFFVDSFRSANSRFFGFDTFEGLPEDWGHRVKGTFTTQGKPPQIDDERAVFVKGLFQETLPYTDLPSGDGRQVILHLDADLYSSTLFVLAQMWQRYAQAEVIFDEFIGDECRALHNFTQAFPSRVTFRTQDGEFPKKLSCSIDFHGPAARARG